jgi:hypothetical protein
MAEEPDNLVVRLLQEVRSEVRDMRADLNDLRTEMNEMRTDLTQRIDGNTLLLNLTAGVVYDHEQRAAALEEFKARFER